MPRQEPLDITVKRDGRVVLHRPFGCYKPVLIGRVERKDTHDGPAWFWSRDNFADECEVAGLRRCDAVAALLETLTAAAK